VEVGRVRVFVELDENGGCVGRRALVEEPEDVQEIDDRRVVAGVQNELRAWFLFGGRAVDGVAERGVVVVEGPEDFPEELRANAFEFPRPGHGLEQKPRERVPKLEHARRDPRWQRLVVTTLQNQFKSLSQFTHFKRMLIL
jgi:hypothetical protein